MARKTIEQVEKELADMVEERIRILIEYPNYYKRKLEAAIDHYGSRVSEEEDGFYDKWAARDEFFFEGCPEADELSEEFNLIYPWDPKGKELPRPKKNDSPGKIISIKKLKEIFSSEDKTKILQIAGLFIIGINLYYPKHIIEAWFKKVLNEHWENFTNIIFDSDGNINYEKANPPKIRRHANYLHKKMAVWKMIEEEAGEVSEDYKENQRIMEILACKIYEQDGWDVETDVLAKERLKANYKALENAFLRDFDLYLGIVPYC